MARRTDLRLDGALALVTGAGSGIGRATSLALAAKGARVLAVDIDGDTAEKTAAACGELGAEARGLVCDVSDGEAMADLAEQVHADRGPLDVLVNNAGVSVAGRWTDINLDDWRWIRGINLDGVGHGCLAFGPAMVERGRGHVVNVSSMLGYTPHGLMAAYGATKAAVLALSQSLRADWAGRGVGVSVVCPGGIKTPMFASARWVGLEGGEREAFLTSFRPRGHPPAVVARAVVRAINRNRAVVHVGWEAKLAWGAHRLLPSSAHQLIARLGVERGFGPRPAAASEGLP